MDIFWLMLSLIAICWLLAALTAYWYHGRVAVTEFTQRQEGRVAIVTGGSRGIGREITRELARLGATVYAGSRDKTTGLSNAEYIRGVTGNPNVHWLPLDLSDLQSVRSFVEEVKRVTHAVHILINNAAIGYSEYPLTVAGYDMVFGTNYLGHFLLTHLLSDLLDRRYGDRLYPLLQGYETSKLALILHAKETARRLASHNVTVNAVYPGLCWTELWNSIDVQWPRPVRWLTHLVLWPALLTSRQAAQTPLYCVLHPDAAYVTARYFYRSKISRESIYAKKAALSTKLYDVSLLLTGCLDHHGNGRTSVLNSHHDYRYQGEYVDDPLADFTEFREKMLREKKESDVEKDCFVKLIERL